MLELIEFKPLLPALALGLLLAPAACDREHAPPDEVAEAGDGDGDGDGDEDLGEAAPDLGSDMLEACESWGESRACDQGGTQFCDSFGAELSWGACLSSFVCQPGETQACDGFGEDSACELEGGVPYWSECDPTGDGDGDPTPLVLSFDGAPVELAASPAAFDIAGVGVCLGTDWPAASNPWLAIDLDRNGFIDGGHELFGSGTVLPSGRRAATGFAALAPLDQNGDGKIDQADPRFDELLIWRDEDADKRSTGWELTSLRDEGIESIDLAFTVREQCDERGNCARERSSFEYSAAGRRRIGEVVDVYLACD